MTNSNSCGTLCIFSTVQHLIMQHVPLCHIIFPRKHNSAGRENSISSATFAYVNKIKIRRTLSRGAGAGCLPPWVNLDWPGPITRVPASVDNETETDTGNRHLLITRGRKKRPQVRSLICYFIHIAPRVHRKADTHCPTQSSARKQPGLYCVRYSSCTIRATICMAFVQCLPGLVTWNVVLGDRSVQQASSISYLLSKC